MDFTKLVRFDGSEGGGSGEGGGEGSGDVSPADGKGSGEIKTFEQIMEGWDEQTKAAYEENVRGLKTALNTERETNRLNEPKIKELAKLEEEREKTRVEGLTPEEKAKAELATERGKREAAEQKQRELNERLRAIAKEKSFDDVMIDLDLWFVDEAAQNDAYKMLDEEEFDDDFSQMEAAIKKLAKSRSYLFKLPKKEETEDTKTKKTVKTEEEKKSREERLRKKYRIAG